jgi:subtilase family serine protease
MQSSIDRVIPACSGSRIGRAQCDVLLESNPFRPDTPAGWAPADLQAAYNLPSAAKGKGQIVALVDAYDNPDVASDLAAYRSTYGLPTANFAKYNQKGQQSNYPSGSPGWGVEIDLDVDMVSASCPKCTIYLVEANSSQWSDIETAQVEAVKLGAHIVSDSFGGTGADEHYWNNPDVAEMASAGDSGLGLEDPATFIHVAAVGGTVLSKGGGGKRGWTESVWADAGGGCSSGESKPGWQHDRYAKSCKGRVGDDVSAVAEGVAEYDTYGESGWITVDGTSISSPLIAGVFGLAGNATEKVGGRTFWLKLHDPYIYRVEENGKYVRFSYGGGWGTPDGIGAF